MTGIVARLSSAGQTVIGPFRQPLNAQNALNYVHLTFEPAKQRLDRACERAARSEQVASQALAKAQNQSTSSNEHTIVRTPCESSTAVASSFLAKETTPGGDAEAKVTTTVSRSWVSSQETVSGRRQSSPAAIKYTDESDSEDEVSGDVGETSLLNQASAAPVVAELEGPAELDHQAPVLPQHLEAAARYQESKGVPEGGGYKLRLANMAFELKQLLGLGFLTLPGGEAIERFRESNVVDASLKAVYLGIPSMVQLAFQAISGLAFNLVVLAVVDGAKGLLSVAKTAGACAKGCAVKARDTLKGALPSCCPKANSPKEVSASPRVSSKSSKKSSKGLLSRGFNAVKQAGSSAASGVRTGAKWVKDFFTWPRSHVQAN